MNYRQFLNRALYKILSLDCRVKGVFKQAVKLPFLFNCKSSPKQSNKNKKITIKQKAKQEQQVLKNCNRKCNANLSNIYHEENR